jgi:hypothetical protein
MNAFYQHHKASIRFGYRCFDRILLNGVIQPFQQPECASASKGNPTSSVYQRLDFPMRIPVSGGSRSAPMGTPP